MIYRLPIPIWRYMLSVPCGPCYFAFVKLTWICQLAFRVYKMGGYYIFKPNPHPGLQIGLGKQPRFFYFFYASLVLAYCSPFFGGVSWLPLSSCVGTFSRIARPSSARCAIARSRSACWPRRRSTCFFRTCG